MINTRIASTFVRVATLLEQQGGSPFRVRAWRDAAATIAEWPREMADVFHDHGRIGLEALPHIGPRLASVLIEMITSGRCAALDRLEGEAGIEAVEEIEVADQQPRRRSTQHRVPSAELLLDVDREYRAAAAAGRLFKIAPRRFNPEHEAWLPILHLERDGFAFTAMYSNTELAHHLGRTHDWVIIYFHEPHGPEAQATVVTEHRGARRGHRVVRGRERECAMLDDDASEPETSWQAG